MLERYDQHDTKKNTRESKFKNGVERQHMGHKISQRSEY